MAAVLYRLGTLVARHRLIVIPVWIAALVGVGAVVSQVGAATTNDLQLPGTDSQRATDLLAARFPPHQNGKSPLVFYDAAQPITQAIVLPLYFISGMFVPVSGLPQWLNDIAKIFPVSQLAAALLVAYNPYTTGSGFAWSDLAVLVLWGVGWFIVAQRRFTWMPRGR